MTAEVVENNDDRTELRMSGPDVPQKLRNGVVCRMLQESLRTVADNCVKADGVRFQLCGIFINNGFLEMPDSGRVGRQLRARLVEKSKGDLRFFVSMSALPVIGCPALNAFFFNGIFAVRHRFDAASVVAGINLFD